MLYIYLKKRIHIFIIVLLLSVCMSDSKSAQAASASVSVTVKDNDVVKGDAVYVIITVDSSDEIGGFKGYFSYDNSVLRYVTGGSVISGNDDEFLVSDTDRETGTHKIKYVVKFIARAAGNTTIKLKNPYAVYSYDDNQTEMSVSYIPLNIVVRKKEQMQTKKPVVTQAPVVTEAPTITNKPEETKEPVETKKPPTKANNSNNSNDIKASLKNGEIVLSTKEKYTVTELTDKTLLPEGFGETAIKIGDKLITAYVLENSTDHKFMLIYCKKGDHKPEFYLYDKEEMELMPYEKVQAWYRGNSGNSVVIKDADNNIEVQKFKYILAIVIIICLLLVIITISVYMHFKGMSKDDLTEILK